MSQSCRVFYLPPQRQNSNRHFIARLENRLTHRKQTPGGNSNRNISDPARAANISKLDRFYRSSLSRRKIT